MHLSLKSPAQNVVFWVTLVTLVILSVPWYFGRGNYKPIVGGIPLWTLIIIIVNLVFAIFITYSAYKLWR